MYKNVAYFYPLQSIAASSTSGSYVLLATILFPIVEVTFKNLTNGDILVSTDGTNDMLLLPTNSYSDKDIRTNSPMNTDLTLPENISIFVKQGPNTPTSGSFYMEAIVVKPLGTP
jgi:hypothetical protein